MQVDPRESRLSVADIVGPTVLAQGTAAGRRCALIRLGGCNLSCSWCDVPFTWDSTRYDLASRLDQWPAAEVAAAALSCAPSLVVVTGGEPLIQQRAEGWRVLLDALAGVEIGVETNGTIAPTDETMNGVSWITVSPKLQHAGDPSWDRIKGDVLIRWGALAVTHEVEFVFVVRDSSDVDEIRTLVAIHDLPPHRVWVSPEGATAAAVVTRLHQVADAAVSAGFNVAPRITNPFGGPALTERTGFPVTGATAAPVDEPEPEAARPPVGARFRRT